MRTTRSMRRVGALLLFAALVAPVVAADRSTKLVPPDLGANAMFGIASAAAADTAVVGANWGENGAA